MNVRELRLFLETVPDNAKVCVASEDNGECIFDTERAFLFPSSNEVWITVTDEEPVEDEDLEVEVLEDIPVDPLATIEQENMKKYGTEV